MFNLLLPGQAAPAVMNHRDSRLNGDGMTKSASVKQGRRVAISGLQFSQSAMSFSHLRNLFVRCTKTMPFRHSLINLKPLLGAACSLGLRSRGWRDVLRSEEHTSEHQSLMRNS